MAKRLTVVLSQGQSNNPAKRKLEETLATELIMAEGIEVMLIPHLYDLPADGSAMVALRGITGDFVLLSWLYARAAHWTLDRHNVRGQLGETALKSAWDGRKKKWEKQTKDYRPDASTPRVLDDRPRTSRTIHHIDLRLDDNAQIYVREIKRLATDKQTLVVNLVESSGESQPPAPQTKASTRIEPTVVEEQSPRRWYPVIDFSRCTNCMECIDFCLFGVYGIDQHETILVEQPDNCRKGCPACSRVCPENAIIFPQHKTPIIAGDPSIGGEMKIDLSQLFGKPNDLDTAARERDDHLLQAGRGPVGTSTVSSHDNPQAVANHKDELDELIDELDELDL